MDTRPQRRQSGLPVTVIPPSGEQFELRFGDQRCTVTEVGATVRSYRDSGRDVLHPYAIDAMCDGGHGAPLIPWPNRIRDGRYRFDGVDHQLALTEPSKRNAIHGLLRWQPWVAAEHAADRVVMRTRLHPVTGYPFRLDVEIAYVLDEGGLTVTTSAQNSGERPCPYGSGQHPYLSAGDGPVDACTVHLQADTWLRTDPERQIPVGTEPVAGTPLDFRGPTSLDGLAVDTAFTDLDRDGEGRAGVRLGRPDGCTVELWADRSYPVIQLYTADSLAGERRRSGLAAEPMTCPPNAFQSGSGVIRLEPGESTTSTWGVRLR